MTNLQKYYEENFFIIPIKKNDKRPRFRKWTDYSISFIEAQAWIKSNGNIGVVAGKQSMKEGYELIIIDIDNRPEKFEVEYFREFGTWVQFTPNGGFHIFLRVKPHENVTKTEMFLEMHDLTPHRTNLDPKHGEITFNSPTTESDKRMFADTIRWTSMYALVSPSKVNGKSYWWLDDMEGEIRKL